MDAQVEDFAKDKFSLSHASWLFAGVAIGAISAYFLDPERGKRRRHVLRDQFFSKVRSFSRHVEKMARDYRNRLFGFVVEWRKGHARSGYQSNAVMSTSGSQYLQ